MGKPNFQRTTISRIMTAAPKLKYIAFYHADETRINACMNGYKDRSFVYVLTFRYEDREHYLYAGKSKAQYARFLNHLRKYAFDHIYLFECAPEHLVECEAAVIKELMPLFNQYHNPQAKHNKQFLGIRYNGQQDAETIRHYFDLQSKYAPVGLFGFSLPPAVFSVLEKKAAEANCNCSELLQKILEDAFPQEIANELHNSHSPTGQTNLITSKSYGVLHNRSREQIKQYFGQKNRVLGAAKIGRDWVLPKDATFPTDQRRKVPK